MPTSESTTDEGRDAPEPRQVRSCAHRMRFVAAGDRLGIALGLRILDCVSSGGFRCTLRSGGPVDAGEFRARLECRAVRALLFQYLPAGKPDPRLPARGVHP